MLYMALRQSRQLSLLSIAVVLLHCAERIQAQRPVQVPSPALAPGEGPLILTNEFPLPPYLANYRAGNVATDWNSAVQWILFASNASNTAPRLMAFTHYAMWEAWKANNESSRPANASAVTSYAAMIAMKNLVPLYFDKYDQLVDRHTSGLSVAEKAAALDAAKEPVRNFLATRLTDGFQDVSPLPLDEAAEGRYVATGPDPVRPVQQYASTVPLLLPANLDEIEIIANFSPPAAVGSNDYNIEYRSVFLYGDINSTLRSATQTTTALFWGDREASLTTILAQWNRAVIGTLPADIPLETTIALLAEYNAGMYDCVCSTFFLAYRFDQWRPVTAIRLGDSDHPPNVTWTPLLTTPGYPGYPAFGGCYAGFSEAYLARFYETDQKTFIVTTTNSGGNGYLLPTRTYMSFSQVASEVSQSRYFSGVEFPADADSARDLGNYIASYFQDGFTITTPPNNISSNYLNRSD